MREKEYSREDMIKNLRLAHKEWLEKESFFSMVTEPDLIDYAIFDMEAAKLKYIYLLKKMKEEDAKGELVLEHNS